MDNKSLLEVLEREKKVCDRLQSVRNMLVGLRSAAEENRANLARQSNILDRLTEEAETLGTELVGVRKEIRSRLVGYECEYGGDDE